MRTREFLYIFNIKRGHHGPLGTSVRYKIEDKTSFLYYFPSVTHSCAYSELRVIKYLKLPSARTELTSKSVFFFFGGTGI
jgi:hypothetical protein